MRIATVTCVTLPEVDPDAPLLAEALRDHGATPSCLAWDDPDADFASQDLVVLRSTWNYHRDLAAFLAWVDRTSTQTNLANPAHVVHANARKIYLLDLERRGVAVVPTEIVRRGETRTLAEVSSSRGWSEVVVKPLVSCGSFQTERFTPPTYAEGEAFLASMASERDVLVQAWMPAVDTSGERSLVWIDGELTHAVRKAPRFAGGHESVSTAPVPIADDERGFATRVLEASGFARDLLYARVDAVRDDDGALRLMELELIEPSLFLAQHPPALERFAKAIVRRARAGRDG